MEEYENRDGNAKFYRCVGCGAGAPALTRSYGPTVLKLATCEKCGCIVDKYIEYDPVIVMIDLILVTREALRHILHNTKFKIFWKLLIVLAILETYGVWCRKNIINFFIESLCPSLMSRDSNSTLWNVPVNVDTLRDTCFVWQQDVKMDEADPFIWEKTFYTAFASVFSGTIAFTIAIHALSKVATFFSIGSNVSAVSLLKTITIGNMANLFTLPLLIWGVADENTNHVHILLVFAYSFLVFLNATAVMYDFNIYAASGILVLAYLTKFTTVYVSKQLIETIF